LLDDESADSDGDGLADGEALDVTGAGVLDACG
jgi:hypothetical protein